MVWISFDKEKYPIEEIAKFKPESVFQKKVVSFIQQWQEGEEKFVLHTSGSTGKPKEITISRNQMCLSAEQTIKALNLLAGQTALLCINPAFIGGKMMLVRALINDMNIVAKEPSSNPLKDIDTQIDFMALVPMQLTGILSEESTKQKLNELKAVIVGGGTIGISLENDLQKIVTPIYSTYGMTETVSHIALRKVNGQDKSTHFTAFNQVEIDRDTRGCLTINSPITNHKTIVTNDLVELIDEKNFKWLGRIDNVINSGGIKIQSEELEQKIGSLLSENGLTSRFFIYGLPDEVLGQQVTLFIEGGGNKADQNMVGLLKESLTRYEAPKSVVFIKKFIETDNGKIQRIKTVKLYSEV
jgi:o-succinylbenzoate---CoA ligase